MLGAQAGRLPPRELFNFNEKNGRAACLSRVARTRGKESGRAVLRFQWRLNFSATSEIRSGAFVSSIRPPPFVQCQPLPLIKQQIN